MSLTLTHKDLLELKHWLRADMGDERAQLKQYLEALGITVPRGHAQILEIGTGPHWGLLPYLDAHLKFAVDPLFPVYHAAGILEDRGDIRQVDECFERWDTNETFDAILTTNALDHGEMDFYVVLKVARLLKPGGRFYLHVNLRPPELLNLIHDHSLTEEKLDKHLSYTNLFEERRVILDQDLDGFPCRTLVGVWRKLA
jgi:hypothetical protein